jgi:hypothetical protein
MGSSAKPIAKAPAEAPNRIGASGNDNGNNFNVNNNNLTHDDISRKFAKGEITASQMQSMMQALDAQIEAEYQRTTS